MVVSTLDKVAVGESFDSLPPHVTIFPWFDLDKTLIPLFESDIQDIIMHNPVALPEGGSTDLFDQDESIAVRRFDVSTFGFNVIQHFNIHASVFRSVNELGGAYDSTYVGLNYAPHLTQSEERSVHQGEVVFLNNLTVFKKDKVRRKKLVQAIYIWDKING